MPAAFEKCRTNGGKIRTRSLSNGRYQHICILSGKVYKGEIKHKQTHNKSGAARMSHGKKAKRQKQKDGR